MKRWIYILVVCFLSLGFSSCDDMGWVSDWKSVYSDFESYGDTPFGVSHLRDILNKDQRVPDVKEKAYKDHNLPVLSMCRRDSLYMMELLGSDYSRVFVANTFDVFGTYGDRKELKLDGHCFSLTNFVKDANNHKHSTISLSTIVDETTQKKYKFPTEMCSSYFSEEAINYLNSGLKRKAKVLASVDGHPIAICYELKKNVKVTLVSAPFLFTNYGCSFSVETVDSGELWSSYARNVNLTLILSIMRESGFANSRDPRYMDPMSIIIKPYELDSEERFYSTNPVPSNMLRTILYLFLPIVCLLFFVLVLPFCIKRRQRIIPVIKVNENKTVPFVCQLGELYCGNNEYTDLMKMRIVTFYADVKKRLHIDLNDKKMLDQNALSLASVTQTDVNTIKILLRNLNKAKVSVDSRKMISYVKQMDMLTKKMNGK
ncbi:MAG: hypothetical protein MJZ00_00245 [Paludibacteraceae bacterium]|nr:hypothetical protein [Paludibacteraceae bacterium]